MLSWLSSPIGRAAGAVRAAAERATGGAGASNATFKSLQKSLKYASSKQLAGEGAPHVPHPPPAEPPLARQLSAPGHSAGRLTGMPGAVPTAVERQQSDTALRPSRASSAAAAAAAAAHGGGGHGGHGHRLLVMQDALQGAMKGYLLALMLVVLVMGMGVAIAMGVHRYSLVNALYWTIGCMTTAGGDLHADNNTLKVAYIIYMPIGAVTMLTAGRTILVSSQRRDIRTDNFTLQLYSLLGREARRKADRHAKLREAEFIVSVLQARKMVDAETVDAIRTQFATLVPHDGDPAAEPAIDAQLVFENLVRQRRVLSNALRPKGDMSPRASVRGGRASAPTAGLDDDDAQKTATAYVDMTSEDNGFAEWFEGYWTPSVEQAASSASAAGELSMTPNSGNGGYTRLLEA